jgi:predicted nucleotidyltransferase
LEGVVSKDDEGIFTPCTYLLQCASIKGYKYESPREIVSFRGQFCEQAKKGEKVIARGKIEECVDENGRFRRLLLGNTRRDFMVAYPSASGG